MEQWLEVCEKIQAEFRNCYRAFKRMKEVWSERADLQAAPTSPPHPHTCWSFGHAAYARRQAHIYDRLYHDCIAVYEKCKFEKVGKNEILVDVLVRQREEIARTNTEAIAYQVAKAIEMTEAMAEGLSAQVV